MKELMRAFLNWRMLIVFAMGFSSGLPLFLVGSTLKAWFTDSGMDLTTIGFFSLVGIPYSLKFLWSPLLDRYIPPFLGRRRGWLLITQVGLAMALATLAFADPTTSTLFVAVVAFSVAFLSATQDIALDAYRRELLETKEFGLGNSIAITGYRMAILFSGAFALILAQYISWKAAYLIMAAGMFIGIITTLLCPEPTVEATPPQTLKSAFTDPFKDYFSRPRAFWILAFILLYKVGDSMAAEMTMPFYLQNGFTKAEVAGVVKIFGIWAVIAGGLIGGTLMLRIGLQKSLWVFGILQACSTLGFAWLSGLGGNVLALTAVISFENISSGMGTAAYVAFMASLTNKRFTATQYALLSSLMSIPRVIVGAPTGYMAERLGWELFFIVCAFAAVPGLLLLAKMGKWAKSDDDSSAMIQSRTIESP